MPSFLSQAVIAATSETGPPPKQVTETLLDRVSRNVFNWKFNSDVLKSVNFNIL